MDGYFIVPPPVLMPASYAPISVPWGNVYAASNTLIDNFWSVRDLWAEEGWKPQSESTIAASLAPIQQASYIPHGAMTPVVILSW